MEITVPRRASVRLILLVAFYVFYIVVGAAIFSAVEGPEEKVIANHMTEMRERFVKRHSCLTESDLDALLATVIEANNKGVSAVRNVTTESNWSFGQAIFFATSILTTIGYGHVTPLSDGGKMFCVVYASVGIPITLIIFTALVERLMVLTNFTLQALNSRIGHLYRALHVRLIHVGILLVILIITVFLIPAAIFSALEDHWNYLDSFYYCFISMTTIGLGDYIPGDSYKQPLRPIYKIGTAIYLVVGLVFMMLILANVYEIPELNIGNHVYMHGDDDVLKSRDTGTIEGDEERKKLRSTGGGMVEQAVKYGGGGETGVTAEVTLGGAGATAKPPGKGAPKTTGGGTGKRKQVGADDQQALVDD